MIKRSLVGLYDLIDRQSRLLLLVSVCLLVIAGTGYSIALGDALRYPDEREYYTLATSLRTRGQYALEDNAPTAFRPPGYPLILYVLLVLNAPIPMARILNFGALALCACILYRILAKEASERAGLLGALLVLGYPVLFYTAGTLYPQVIGSALFVTVLLLVTGGVESPFPWFLAGLAFGYLVLTIPSFLLIIPIFVLAPWALGQARKLQKAGSLLVAAMAVVLIWTARNYVTFHRFVLVSSNSGLNLLLGNSENVQPNSGVNTDISRYVGQALKLDEFGRDAFYRQAAIEWIASNKLEAAKLYGLKVLNYFNYRNELRTTAEGSRLKDILMLLTYGALFLTALLRVAVSRIWRLTRFEILLYVSYIWSALASAIFFTRIRFRIPFDFLLVCIAAMFLDSLLGAWFRPVPLIATAARGKRH
jgi:hypothetical protein